MAEVKEVGESTGIDAKEAEEQVRLSDDLITRYSGARNQWATNALQDDKFRNNVQWTQEQINTLEGRAQNPIVVNVIHSVVEQAKAMLTANKPRFSSTGREDSDTRLGKLFADIMAYVWDVSSGNGELKQTIDDYFVRGMGTMFAYSDPFADGGRGEVYVKALDPFDVYIDPSSKDRFCRDAAHILIARLLTREQFELNYQGYKDLLVGSIRSAVDRHPKSTEEAREGQMIGTQMLDPSTDYYEVIDRYTKIFIPQFEVFDSSVGSTKMYSQTDFQGYIQQPAAVLMGPDGQVQYVTDLEGVQQVVASLRSGETDPGLAQIITIKDLIQVGVISVSTPLTPRIRRVMSVGGKLMCDVILPIEDYPIVPFMNRHNRNPYPMSDVRFVRPIQQYINKIRSLIVAHASNSTNVKLLIPRGSQDKKKIEEEWGRAGTAVIEYDPEFGVPIVAGPVPLPNELYKNEADAKHDIESIFGIFAMMQGDGAQAPTTYKGTVALDEYGQRRIKSKKDDIEDGLNQLARVIVQLIQSTYTERKVIRLIQPNNVPKDVQLNVPIYDEVSKELISKYNDVTVGRYDVIVIAGSTLPSNRWARFEYYMELYKAGLIDQVEVLKQTEVADMEGVLSRFGQMQQMQQQIAQLEKELKDTQGNLQTAQRESVQDRKRVEVEKFKTKLNTTGNKAQLSGQLFDERLRDQLRQHGKNLDIDRKSAAMDAQAAVSDIQTQAQLAAASSSGE